MNKERSDDQNKNEPHRISLRDIAAELGVSHVSVSRALRNLKHVSPELKARIQAKADEMGYVPDPLLASLSQYSKNGRNQPIKAELAWLNTWSNPERLCQFKEFDLYWKGAFDHAQKMGFELVEFKLADTSVSRLQDILRARNIQGILLPPLRSVPKIFDTFNWNEFAIVCFGQSMPNFHCNFVSSSQQGNAMLAFDRMQELGYQRLGCACTYLRRRLFGSGFFWAQQILPASQQVPILSWDRKKAIDIKQTLLKQWLDQYQPDAVLTDDYDTPLMLKNLGYRIPKDIALATTTIHDTDIDSGIDQQPYEIGRAAIRMLSALINERNFGFPKFRSKFLIEGTWVDGSMMPNVNIDG